ncbi:MAG: hypothetical protein PHV97_05620 [Candidatus Omnitrophica bacterium]|nr:hypothetical protein [Candidatus Omnitrophota bacterium]
MKRNQLFAALVLSGLMFASCASSSSKNPYGPYSAAEIFYKKGNYPKAIEKYQEYLADTLRAIWRRLRNIISRKAIWLRGTR